MKPVIAKYGADAAGLAGHLCIVVGIWARYGWPWALIVAGAPFAAFYFWGEYRSTRGES